MLLPPIRYFTPCWILVWSTTGDPKAPLDHINKAFDYMHEGKAIRSLIVY